MKLYAILTPCDKCTGLEFPILPIHDTEYISIFNLSYCKTASLFKRLLEIMFIYLAFIMHRHYAKWLSYITLDSLILSQILTCKICKKIYGYCKLLNKNKIGS